MGSGASSTAPRETRKKESNPEVETASAADKSHADSADEVTRLKSELARITEEAEAAKEDLVRASFAKAAQASKFRNQAKSKDLEIANLKKELSSLRDSNIDPNSAEAAKKIKDQEAEITRLNAELTRQAEELEAAREEAVRATFSKAAQASKFRNQIKERDKQIAALKQGQGSEGHEKIEAS